MDINETRLSNLNLLIEKYGSQANLAKNMEKVEPSYISMLVNGHRGFGERSARNFEKKLGLPKGWFDTERKDGEKDVTVIDKNVEPIQLHSGFVPLISWVNAGNWEAALDDMGTYEHVSCPFSHSRGTYALRVRGISMYNPEGKDSFSDGDIIFVDPNRQPLSGDFIIAMHERDFDATFKQYHEEDGKKFLMALNPDWSPRLQEVKEDTSVIGVIVGHQVNKKYY